MITNGEIRQKVYEGNGKGVMKWVFAGNAHMNEFSNVISDEPTLNIDEFRFVMETTQRNKIREKEK